MVSNRCKIAVRDELKKLGLHIIVIDLGEVDILENISLEDKQQLNNGLLALGLELIEMVLLY